MVNLLLKNSKILTLLLAVVFLVSGCFVDENKNPTIPLPSGPITMPIYKHGDRLEYNVFGTLTTDNVSSDTNGSLVIRWQNETSMRDPFDQDQIIPNVLKEESTLDVRGLGREVTTIRYITQDANRCLQVDLVTPPTTPAPDGQTCDSVGLVDNPNYGTIRLIAIDEKVDATPPQIKRYWATTDIANTAKDVLVPPVIVSSPISTGPLVETGLFDLLFGCNVVTKKCTDRISRVKYSTQFALINDQGRPTVFGTFVTARTNLNSLSIQSMVETPENYLRPSVIDVRAACYTIIPDSVASDIQTNITGQHEVHPNFGNIYMLDSCDPRVPSSKSFTLHFELDDFAGSFVLP